MLNCLRRNPFYLNKNISDYCRKSTEESMKRITLRYNLERKKLITNDNFVLALLPNNNHNNNNNSFYLFFTILSIPTITYILYRIVK